MTCLLNRSRPPPRGAESNSERVERRPLRVADEPTVTPVSGRDPHWLCAAQIIHPIGFARQAVVGAFFLQSAQPIAGLLNAISAK